MFKFRAFCPKRPLGGPQRPTRGATRPQEAPKRPPRGPQEAPKRLQRGPQDAPKSPQESPPRTPRGTPGDREASREERRRTAFLTRSWAVFELKVPPSRPNRSQKRPRIASPGFSKDPPEATDQGTHPTLCAHETTKPRTAHFKLTPSRIRSTLERFAKERGAADKCPHRFS